MDIDMIHNDAGTLPPAVAGKATEPPCRLRTTTDGMSPGSARPDDGSARAMTSHHRPTDRPDGIRATEGAANCDVKAVAQVSTSTTIDDHANNARRPVGSDGDSAPITDEIAGTRTVVDDAADPDAAGNFPKADGEAQGKGAVSKPSDGEAKDQESLRRVAAEVDSRCQGGGSYSDR